MTKETFESILKELDQEDRGYLLINTNIAVGRGINGVDFTSYLIGEYRAKDKDSYCNAYVDVERVFEMYNTFIKVYSRVIKTNEEIEGETFVPYESIVSVISCDKREAYLLNKNY